MDIVKLKLLLLYDLSLYGSIIYFSYVTEFNSVNKLSIFACI